MIYMQHNNRVKFPPVQWDTWKFNKTTHAKAAYHPLRIVL